MQMNHFRLQWREKTNNEILSVFKGVNRLHIHFFWIFEVGLKVECPIYGATKGDIHAMHSVTLNTQHLNYAPRIQPISDDGKRFFIVYVISMISKSYRIHRIYQSYRSRALISSFPILSCQSCFRSYRIYLYPIVSHLIVSILRISESYRTHRI